MSSYWQGRVTVTPHLTVNLTKDDWQLYDKPGAVRAAKAISGSIETILNRSNIDWAKASAEGAKVLEKYSEFGARDTEGMNVLRMLLDLRFPGERD